jgi:hypothetical protein
MSEIEDFNVERAILRNAPWDEAPVDPARGSDPLWRTLNGARWFRRGDLSRALDCWLPAESDPRNGPLARTWAARPTGPGFLIHDSTLFDGADERQFTQALYLASLTSQNENFQYLCCLNSDRIPTSGFPDSFDWRNFVKLTLRDGSPDGGLFGFRFGEGPAEPR